MKWGPMWPALPPLQRARLEGIVKRIRRKDLAAKRGDFKAVERISAQIAEDAEHDVRFLLSLVIR